MFGKIFLIIDIYCGYMVYEKSVINGNNLHNKKWFNGNRLDLYDLNDLLIAGQENKVIDKGLLALLGH